MKLKVLRLRDDAVMPRYPHPGDSGLDLFSVDETNLEPGTFKSIHTGIAVELPAGTEAQIRPRSGLAVRRGITVLNTPGTIDAGYRGEIEVVLINHGSEEFHIEKGMRIAQMVINPVVRVDVQEVSELSTSLRGASGFGSTDKHVEED
jgi:dUTP pyrophosphatase